MEKYHGNCWPNKTHMLLLRAALSEAPLAINAWEQWASTMDIDKVDPFSYQIMPKIYKNLLNAGVHFAHHHLLKGIYKHTWMHNQLLFDVCIKTIQKWPLYGTQKIMLMKGAAMVVGYYQDFGVRVMGDVDILVPIPYMVSMMQHLLDHGFEATDPLSLHKRLTSEWTSPRHAISFKRKNTADVLLIDIHTSPLLEICSHHQTKQNWFENASPVRYHGIELFRLNATDLLFQTCVHGTKYSAVPLFRWIMDASIIIEKAQAEIDWDSILWQCREYDLVLPMKNAFHFLHENFQVNIPEHILSKINELPISPLDKKDFHYKSKKKGRLLHMMVSLWSRSRRQKKSLIAYLTAHFELDSALHLPKIAGLKAWHFFKRLRKSS